MKAFPIVAATALAAMTITLTAAEVDAGGRRGGARGQRSGGGRAGQALQLSDDQRAQIQTLRVGTREQLQQLRDSGEGSRESAQALRAQNREEFLGILTDDQRATLEQLRAERLENRPEGDGERPVRKRRRGRDSRDGSGERAEALGLTEDQRSEVHALRQSLREQLKALRESGDATREDAQALRQQNREQVLGLFTDEQRAQIEAWRANRPEGRRHRPPVDGDDGTSQLESAVSAPTAVESSTWGQVKTRQVD